MHIAQLSDTEFLLVRFCLDRSPRVISPKEEMSVEAINISMTLCNLIVLPLFMPLNIAVIWVRTVSMFSNLQLAAVFQILKTKQEFKSRTAYTIIFAIAVLDCFHMITTFVAGIFNLAPKIVSELFGRYVSCMRNGYLFSIPILEFFLAANRLVIISKFHGCGRGTRLFKFSYHEATYRYTGPAYFETPYIYIRMGLEGTALALYLVTVGVIICQQSVYHMHPLKFSRREVRLLGQALLQSIPVAFTIFIGAFLYTEIWKHGLLFIVWSVTAITIPATHLLILILFNANVRKHLKSLLRKCPHSKVFVTTARKSGSTRSGGHVEVTRIIRTVHK
ncbi:hypothetical protein QR680_009934 [Steinernema hermaphroditum]|uniref:Uncharacterized protein n=1 Tax=Steinernema hermaphroditum TaxID=289476 RepID=A0AA39IPN5_9BILA|nr:hypothetical protein QR680_009934 [Steinernema hermaphroditum]